MAHESRDLERVAHKLQTAQRLFEGSVRDCRDAGFDVTEIAVIARLTVEQVQELLDHPRTLDR